MRDFLNSLYGPVGAIAAVLPLVLIASRYAKTLFGRRRVLGFRSKVIQIVLTSSETREDSGASGVIRHTTGMGSVVGLAVVARAIGRYFRRTDIRVNMSARVGTRLGGDLVSLGGPRRNTVTRLVLQTLVDKSSSQIVAFDDVSNSLRVGTFDIINHDFAMANDVPTSDVGVVVRAPNPYGGGRVVLCFGFSSYSTAGAANWLFDVALPQWTKFQPRSVRRKYLPSPSRNRADILVLGMQLVDGVVIGERVMHVGSFDLGD